jgi:FdhD protein
MTGGAVSFNYSIYDGEWQEIEAEVIEEGQLTIFVNGGELATLMCTPRDPLQLALGFLANEELISDLSEVEIDYVCPGGGCVDIWLSHSIWDRPRRRIITSGCSGGQTFSDLSASRDPLESDLQISPDQIGSLLAQLQSRNSLYARARGVHGSALSDGEHLVIVAEDIGRHNTLDRLRGECLRQGIDSRGMILLSTGRISTEMINKAVKMGCPVVASRTSPTSLTVGLARAWNITLCGYVRRNKMNVYAHPERLVSADYRLPDQTTNAGQALTTRKKVD